MKISNYREQLPGSKIHALFDLEIDVKIPELDVIVPWNCRNWKIIKTSSGGFFPVSPSFGEETSPGQRKWINYVEPDVKFSKEISKTIMKLLEPHLKPEKPEKESNEDF